MRVVLLPFAVSPCPELLGQEAAKAEAELSVYDRIWSYADWYHNQENPVIQRFQFTGRFQLDYSLINSDQGDEDEVNIRRFRAGARARLFENFTLHGEADLNPQEPEPAFRRLTHMYLAWSRTDELIVTLGKHSAPFTLSGSTSSRELITIDRGNLAHNIWFRNEYFPGMSVSGKPGDWRYFAGTYSAGAQDRLFGEFNGGVFFLGTVGYDFATQLNSEQALLAVNYVYQEPDSDSDWTPALQHVSSLNFRYDTGKWGFRADVSGGIGCFDQSNLWGAELLPFYNITDQLQVVVRCSYVRSDGDNGVRLALYENTIVEDPGDDYNEIYLGLNYFLYGHKLKVQTGVQYSHMRDRANDGGEYSGWAWTTGLRIFW